MVFWGGFVLFFFVVFFGGVLDVYIDLRLIRKRRCVRLSVLVSVWFYPKKMSLFVHICSFRFQYHVEGLKEREDNIRVLSKTSEGWGFHICDRGFEVSPSLPTLE